MLALDMQNGRSGVLFPFQELTNYIEIRLIFQAQKAADDDNFLERFGRKQRQSTP